MHVDPAVTPKFHKVRTVPYTYQAMVKAKLSRLVEQDISTSVQFADWTASIAPAFKGDKRRQ